MKSNLITYASRLAGQPPVKNLIASPASSFAIAAAESFSVGYTKAHDITPNSFTVKKGEKVHLEINPTDTATGCMSDIMIPGLWDKPQPLVKGKKILMFVL